MRSRKSAAERLRSAAVLCYCCWLLLPAVQCLTHAVTGVLTLVLFLCGVVLDFEDVRAHLGFWVLEGACMTAVPVCALLFMGRGADPLGFLCEAVMFFFPPVYACDVLRRGCAEGRKALRLLLIGVTVLTVCTTIGWLIQGMTRGGKVYAYSRSLGYAGSDTNAAYLRELMLRNIGGYDFVYAMVCALPLTCAGIGHARGNKRVLLIALCALQTAMILLSQYTYAMLFTALVLWMELCGALLRKLFKGRISKGASLLLPVLPILLCVLLSGPLLSAAIAVCSRLGLESFAHSFRMLQEAFAGETLTEGSRLGYYLTTLRGIARSPLLGSMFDGERMLSGHSDILDLFSGMGLLGGGAVCILLYFAVQPLLRSVLRSDDRAHLLLSVAMVLCTALLGTVIYSRDIAAVSALGMLLMTTRAESDVDSHMNEA